MTSIPMTARPMRGMTLVEICVGVAVIGIALALASIAYRSLNHSAADVARTTDMQRHVKVLTAELEADLGRAGFGLSGMEIFTAMKPDQVRFLYRDLVGTYCAVNDTVAVTYTAGAHSLRKDLSCGAAPKPGRSVSIAPDSLSLVFTYLDGKGAPTGVSANVRTVEFRMDIVSDPSLKLFGKTRSAKGSVGIVNNT